MPYERISGREIIESRRGRDKKEEEIYQEDVLDEALSVLRETLLDKYADYGPDTALTAGVYGLQIRLMDKVKRAMNLLSRKRESDAKLKELARKAQESETAAEDRALLDAMVKIILSDEEEAAANEPLSDTYLDEAGYGIISYLVHQGKWGYPLREDRW